MAQRYKALKEDFVSNLSGGDIWEINWVTAVAPVSLLPLVVKIIANMTVVGRIPAVVSYPITSKVLR